LPASSRRPDNDHLRSLLGEGDGGGAPDAGESTGDQDNLSAHSTILCWAAGNPTAFRGIDGDDREHAPSAHRRAQASARGNPLWGGRNRRATLGLDSRYQLRLHVRDLPPRTCKISFHAARRRRCICDARVLRPVPNFDAKDRTHIDPPVRPAHRVQLDGRASFSDGAVVLVFLDIGISTLGVGICVLGIEADRFVQIDDVAVVFAFFVRGISALGVGIRVIMPQGGWKLKKSHNAQFLGIGSRCLPIPRRINFNDLY
jgi:hypothetical protein